LRDRLLLARELLAPSGSVFVQISDENLHHVREVMDEVFGSDNFLSVITLKKLSYVESTALPSIADFILCYARQKDRAKYRQLYVGKLSEDEAAERYDQVELADGTRRAMAAEEKGNPSTLPGGSRRYRLDNLVAAEFRPDTTVSFEFEGRTFHPGANSHWKTSVNGLRRLVERRRLQAGGGSTLSQVRFLDDFPASAIGNVWTDISGSIQSRTDPKVYVVQTSTAAIGRCMLMASDPGDLVLDPTCGSGTTPYVAERWGRRWIAIDTSRVPLALARQRLLTATFPYYQLKDDARGPAGGFVYQRKQNNRGEEVGGIVPHVTLKSIANDEPPDQEVLVDRPEATSSITRVSGPFCVEATIPTPVDYEADTSEVGAGSSEDHGSFVDRMLEVLRKSPVLQVGGGKKVTLKNVRPPAKSLTLSAEAVAQNGNGPRSPLQKGEGSGERSIAIVFGPENGAVSEKLVFEAAREAHAKGYAYLYVIGFAIQPNARLLIDKAEEAMGISAAYMEATRDLTMGDLLKTMRSSQIFSVCGMPDVTLRKLKSDRKDATARYEVELLALDTVDPATMETHELKGDDVPA